MSITIFLEGVTRLADGVRPPSGGGAVVPAVAPDENAGELTKCVLVCVVVWLVGSLRCCRRRRRRRRRGAEAEAHGRHARPRCEGRRLFARLRRVSKRQHRPALARRKPPRAETAPKRSTRPLQRIDLLTFEERLVRCSQHRGRRGCGVSASSERRSRKWWWFFWGGGDACVACAQNHHSGHHSFLPSPSSILSCSSPPVQCARVLSFFSASVASPCSLSPATLLLPMRTASAILCEMCLFSLWFPCACGCLSGCEAASFATGYDIHAISLGGGTCSIDRGGAKRGFALVVRSEAEKCVRGRRSWVDHPPSCSPICGKVLLLCAVMCAACAGNVCATHFLSERRSRVFLCECARVLPRAFF